VPSPPVWDPMTPLDLGAHPGTRSKPGRSSESSYWIPASYLFLDDLLTAERGLGLPAASVSSGPTSAVSRTASTVPFEATLPRRQRR
jgi:hypothetical protein